MRPVGLIDPRTGKRPFAVVQLRQDDAAATLYNLVGFQTKMTYPGAAPRVAHDSRAWRSAEFVRLGSLHRNTFINSPARAAADAAAARAGRRSFLAGQLIGVEGYVESAASGLLAGDQRRRACSHGRPLRRAAADHGARLAARVRHRSGAARLPADERQLRPVPAASPAGRGAVRAASSSVRAPPTTRRCWMDAARPRRSPTLAIVEAQ